MWGIPEPVVGPFASKPEVDAWILANPSSAVAGLTATIAGVPAIYQGPGVGWVADRAASLSTSLTSANLWDGVEALADQYIDNDGSIKSAGGYAVSNYFPVSSGDKFLICFGEATLDKFGGYYNGTTWVSPILGSDTVDGIFTVPAGCNAIRITTRRANQANYTPVFIHKTNKAVTAIKTFTSISSIGDSICRGFKATKPFTSVVADRLGITAIDNNGLDSSTIAQSANNPISARMSQLAPADLVLFEGGGNDFNLIPATLGTISDTTNTTFYGALNVCAAYLVKNFPLSTIVWVTVPRWKNWAALNSQSLTMTAYMDALKAVARLNGFIVADGYEQLSLASYPMGYMLASDYAHLNDIGHQMLADVILRAIKNQPH